MSDNSVAGGCLVHYNDQHIQVRKDFFDLCTYNKADFNQGLTRNGKKVKDEPNQECMAKLLRLFETLTNSRKQEWFLKAEKCKAKKIKPPAEPHEYRIELAYSTIVTLLYSTYGESTVRNSIAVLLARGYINRYQETKNSIPAYVLNVPILQKALEKQSKGSEVSISTPGESEVSNSTSEGPKSTPEVSKSTAQVSNSTPNNIEDKKDFEKESKKERPTVVQEPPTSSQPDDSFSHSFVPSSSSSEIIFSPEAEQVYILAEELNLVSLKRDEKHRDNCTALAEKGVTTLEKMDSLIQHCRQVPFLTGKTLNLKNLVNELPGWLQLQRKTTVAPPTGPAMSPFAKATAERLAKEEEIKRKILEQDAARVGPKLSLKEMRDKFAAQKKAEKATQ